MSDTIRKLKRGLYANIHAKRERIKNGSGETMRSPGDKGTAVEQRLQGFREDSKEMSDIIRNLKCNSPKKDTQGGKKFVVRTCAGRGRTDRSVR